MLSSGLRGTPRLGGNLVDSARLRACGRPASPAASSHDRGVDPTAFSTMFAFVTTSPSRSITHSDRRDRKVERAATAHLAVHGPAPRPVPARRAGVSSSSLRLDRYSMPSSTNSSPTGTLAHAVGAQQLGALCAERYEHGHGVRRVDGPAPRDWRGPPSRCRPRTSCRS